MSSPIPAHDVPEDVWKLYISEIEYDRRDIEKLQIIFSICESFSNTLLKHDRTHAVSYNFAGYRDIIEDLWPDFWQQFVYRFQYIHALFNCVIHTILNTNIRQRRGSEAALLQRINVRFHGVEAFTVLKDIRASLVGTLIVTRGAVVQVCAPRLICKKMSFSCNLCKKETIIEQTDGYFTNPSFCADDNCRSKSFTPLLSSKNTKSISYQTIRIQEAYDCREAGRVPRHVECELHMDLVGTVVPGDVVTILGVVRLHKPEAKSKQLTSCGTGHCHGLYIDVNSVTNAKIHHMDCPELSEDDLLAVESIRLQESKIVPLLVASLCPAIYGHEMVKLGLLLGLFGGVRRYADCADKVPVRGDPHVLIVGDPGLGKSQLLHACASVAPHAVYVCGKTTSRAGLTVAVKREGSGDATLEAGALILADNGCCCIDELDKMQSCHPAIFEAMEQQSVSIAKAEVAISLSAKTCILAAANPAGGRYTKAKTVSENLKMGGALLSRFDLVFILTDKANATVDRQLSEHILSLHSSSKRSNSGKQITESSSNMLGASSSLTTEDIFVSLRDRLRHAVASVEKPCTHDLIRKYIAHARQHVQPRLSSQAREKLREFYLSIREKRGVDCIPITTRQLESLVRLTQARAKMEMRSECTGRDADDVIELMRESMRETIEDEKGHLDASRSQHGSGMSKVAQAKLLLKELSKEAKVKGSSKFYTDEIKTIAERVHISELQHVISSLNHQGFLLKKGTKLYQFTPAEM